MMIDVHVHLYTGDGFDRRLIDTARRLGYHKLLLHGIEEFFPKVAGNNEVLALAEKYPDLIVPFAHFRLGVDRPQTVAQLRRRGFRGCKFIVPSKNYDDPEYLPVYQALEQEGMVAFFHTGEIGLSSKPGPSDFSMSRMRPCYLETIARRCPDLIVIGAHLGHEPYYQEALAVARINPNVYFDLASLVVYTHTPQEFARMLWWKHPILGEKSPIHKLLFGSDYYPELIEKHLEQVRQCFVAMDAEAELENIFYGNATRALGKILEGK